MARTKVTVTETTISSPKRDPATGRFLSGTSPVRKSPTRKSTKSPARKSASKSPARKSASKSPARKSASKSPARKSASKSPARKSASKSPARSPLLASSVPSDVDLDAVKSAMRSSARRGRDVRTASPEFIRAMSKSGLGSSRADEFAEFMNEAGPGVWIAGTPYPSITSKGVNPSPFASHEEHHHASHSARMADGEKEAPPALSLGGSLYLN